LLIDVDSNSDKSYVPICKDNFSKGTVDYFYIKLRFYGLQRRFTDSIDEQVVFESFIDFCKVTKAVP